MNFGDFETKQISSAVTNADNKFTLSGHGFVVGDKVQMINAVAGDATAYWVTEVSGNDFKPNGRWCGTSVW